MNKPDINQHSIMTELNIMLPIYSIPYYNNQQLFQLTRVDAILNRQYGMVLIKGGIFVWRHMF